MGQLVPVQFPFSLCSHLAVTKRPDTVCVLDFMQVKRTRTAAVAAAIFPSCAHLGALPSRRCAKRKGQGYTKHTNLIHIFRLHAINLHSLPGGELPRQTGKMDSLRFRLAGGVCCRAK